MFPVVFFIFLFRIICKEPKYSKNLQRLFQVWMGIYMPMIFCPVKHVGRHNFKKGQNYVVVINHNSLADIPVSSPGIPGPNRTLAKAELSKIPLFGYIYKAGSILVTREDMKSRKESFSKMLEVLNRGQHLCLYPEGTRNKTNEPIARFYDGAFKIAIEAQKPIIPGLIFGTKNFLHPTKSFWAWPHKIQFHFLTPIETSHYSLKDADELKKNVHQLMSKYYLENKHLI